MNVQSPNGTVHKLENFIDELTYPLCGNNGGNHYYNDGLTPTTWKKTNKEITCKVCLKKLADIPDYKVKRWIIGNKKRTSFFARGATSVKNVKNAEKFSTETEALYWYEKAMSNFQQQWFDTIFEVEIIIVYLDVNDIPKRLKRTPL